MQDIGIFPAIVQFVGFRDLLLGIRHDLDRMFFIIVGIHEQVHYEPRGMLPRREDAEIRRLEVLPFQITRQDIAHDPPH